MQQEPETHVTLAGFKQAVKIYRKDTLGSDNWGRNELKDLPDIALQPIVGALDYSVKTIASPLQNLSNMNPCLGKPGGDCRTITKTPMLYRMLMRADSDIRDWELKNSSPFDTARIGSSALLAALKRNLRAEIAFWLGDYSAAVFHDLEKFFDSLDIPTLLVEAVKTSFPPSVLLCWSRTLFRTFRTCSGRSGRSGQTFVPHVFPSCSRTLFWTFRTLFRTFLTFCKIRAVQNTAVDRPEPRNQSIRLPFQRFPIVSPGLKALPGLLPHRRFSS